MLSIVSMWSIRLEADYTVYRVQCLLSENVAEHRSMSVFIVGMIGTLSHPPHSAPE